MNRRRKKPVMPSWRGRLLLGLFALAAVTLEARLVWLQLIQADFLTAAGNDRQFRVVEAPAHRGVLEDRNGEPLAVSTPVDSIFVDPQVIPFERIDELAGAVGRDAAALRREIESRTDRQFHYIARRIPPSEAAAVLELGIEGVSAQREYKRFYPRGEVTCHVVGFAGDEDVGQEGLELAFDGRLVGESGTKRVQRDRYGRIIADVEQIEPARPGANIRTSIDLRLQYAAYRALKAAVQASRASSGSVVLLDVRTGEVMAMVNQPFCNPNDLEQRADSSRFRNRAITDPIEPGSTIKPLIAAAALANGLTPDSLLEVPEELWVEGKYLTSDPAGALGLVTLTEVLARSSSVGIGMIGAELEAQSIWGTLKAFGIGELTGDELGTLESRGSFSDSFRNWNKRSQAILSYGYGVSVTPLQLARAYAAIASGGLMPRVTFEAVSGQPERVRVLEPAIASDLMMMLEAVVSDGTASRAAIRDYRVAGKTGTAEIPEGRGYSDDKRRSIFAGIAPASKPRFVAVVVINDPRSQAYQGGEVAAPVFARVMDAALRMHGIAPDDLPETILVSHAEVPR